MVGVHPQPLPGVPRCGPALGCVRLEFLGSARPKSLVHRSECQVCGCGGATLPSVGWGPWLTWGLVKEKTKKAWSKTPDAKDTQGVPALRF